MKTFKTIQVFAVTTNGGQIEYDQVPQPVTVPAFLAPLVAQSFAKYGFCADEFANYYPTESAAARAINWALFN